MKAENKAFFLGRLKVLRDGLDELEGQIEVGTRAEVEGTARFLGAILTQIRVTAGSGAVHGAVSFKRGHKTK